LSKFVYIFIPDYIIFLTGFHRPTLSLLRVLIKLKRYFR